jgi:hypothetical protein
VHPNKLKEERSTAACCQRVIHSGRQQAETFVCPREEESRVRQIVQAKDAHLFFFYQPKEEKLVSACLHNSLQLRKKKKKERES